MNYTDVLPSDTPQVGKSKVCACGEPAQPTSILGHCHPCACAYRKEQARQLSAKHYAEFKAKRDAERAAIPVKLCACGCGKPLKNPLPQFIWATKACGDRVRDRIKAKERVMSRAPKGKPTPQQKIAKQRTMPRAKVEQAPAVEVIINANHPVTRVPSRLPETLRCPTSGIIRDYCGCTTCRVD